MSISPTAPAADDKLPAIVWVLSVIAICVALGFGIVAPALPIFARDFGVGRTAAALVISMFAAARMTSAFGVSHLVDRFGARTLLGIGLIIVAVSSALAGLSQTYIQLLLLRGAGGIGSAMFSVSAASIMANRIPSEVRGRAMSVWSGSFLLGGVLGPVIGAPLVAISLRTPFFFYAATLAVAAVVAFAALPNPNATSSTTDGDQSTADGVRQALRLPSFKVALVASLAQGWGVSTRNALVPLFVTEALLLADEWSGYTLAVAAAMNAVLLLPMGRWSDKKGRLRVVVLGGLASAVGMAALSVPPTMWLLFVGVAILGIGSAAQAVGPSAILGDVAKGRKGSVIAAYQVTGDIGTMIGPVIAGGLADIFGFSAGFGFTAVLSLLSALVAAPYVRSEIPPAAAADERISPDDDAANDQIAD